MNDVLFANAEWYLFNAGRSLASAQRGPGQAVLLICSAGPHAVRLHGLASSTQNEDFR